MPAVSKKTVLFLVLFIYDNLLPSLIYQCKEPGSSFANKNTHKKTSKKAKHYLQCDLNLSLEKKNWDGNPHRQSHVVFILFINSLFSRKMEHLLITLQSSSLTTSVVIHTDFYCLITALPRCPVGLFSLPTPAWSGSPVLMLDVALRSVGHF